MTHILYKLRKTTVFDEIPYAFNHHLSYVLNKIMMEHFQTFEGYMKAFTAHYPHMYLKPMFISADILLMPMFGYKAYENILINYMEIQSISKNGSNTRIIFFNDESIEIKKSYQKIIKQMDFVLEFKNRMKSFSYKDFM